MNSISIDDFLLVWRILSMFEIFFNIYQFSKKKHKSCMLEMNDVKFNQANAIHENVLQNYFESILKSFYIK